MGVPIADCPFELKCSETFHTLQCLLPEEGKQCMQFDLFAVTVIIVSTVAVIIVSTVAIN